MFLILRSSVTTDEVWNWNNNEHIEPKQANNKAIINSKIIFFSEIKNTYSMLHGCGVIDIYNT